MAVHSAPAERPINYEALAQVALLGGTAALIAVKFARSQLDLYIHPRYNGLVLVAALVLLLMALVRLRAVFGERRAANGAYWLLALPLLLGALVPAQPLGADTLSNRGAPSLAAAPAARWNPTVDADTAQWSLLDWATSLSTQGDALAGKQADVIGFVYHDASIGADRFYAVRYVITCCSADGSGVGLPVEWAGGGSLPADSWVRVKGRIASTQINGAPQPAIKAASVEPVQQPDNPYLYP